MEKIIVTGGKNLSGEIEISTAKNSLLPILAASIMCNENIVLHKVSKFSDVVFMIDILNQLGAKTKFDLDSLLINTKDIDNFFLKEDFTKKVRSSVFMLGPLLSKFRLAKIAYPGGCNIGNRPIDLHIKGFESLNVKIIEKHGYIYCDGKNMKSGEIHLDFPSVGATENLMMASVFLKGTTKIYNCAKEPEILDLQNFINSMGGKISGAGTSTITIEGVTYLHESEYTPISDRIISGTYLIACAIAGGDITLKRTSKESNVALLSKLNQTGCKINIANDYIRIISKSRAKSINQIITQPYPGFPTDLQNQLLTLQCVSKGTSLITENLYETRFKVCSELVKMGANITLKDRTALVKGVSKLYGANVIASDLRGGISLVLAGLVADGYTTINEISHIDRGYYKIEEDFTKLNAEIKRIDKL